MYKELLTKYNEISSRRMSLEKNYIGLQTALEEERNARSHGSEHIGELESETTCSNR